MRKLLVNPYNAAKLSIELKEQDGLPVETIRQGFLVPQRPHQGTAPADPLGQAPPRRTPDRPMARVERRSPRSDAAGNIKLSKKKCRKKIDGLAAFVNAIAGATGEGSDDGPSVYDQHGILFL